jgi:hypothetical protein
MGLWWHVYGGEISDLAVDEHGAPGPSWGLLILGESTTTPEDLPDGFLQSFSSLFQHMDYLDSFDHDLSDDEKIALTPTEYL